MSTQGAMGNIARSLWCGCSLIFTSSDSNDSPLIFAAYNGHADVLKVLIVARADVHATNECVMLRMIMNMSTI